MKILLVEDSESTRLFLEVWLRQFGYQAIAAGDGVEALAWLRQDEELQLVVTDWLMPNMDGLELCKHIRALSLPRYVYVLVLTQKSQQSALVEGMDAGADDFLFKPVDKDELRVRIQAGRRVLELEQTLAAQNQQLRLAQSQIQRDLQAAARTQLGLLPNPRVIAGYAFDWRFFPSEWVAGDMLNFFPLTERHLGFYQLDVSGHGIHSALLSFSLYHRLAQPDGNSGLLLERRESQGLVPRAPDQVAADLNQLFQGHQDTDLYFTLLYGVVTIETGEIRFVQAGHPPPLRVDRARQVSAQGGNGFPVGLLPEAEYETQTLRLAPGETLLVYSDGVTDCQDAHGESFGPARLRQQLAAPAHDASAIAESLGQALDDWRQHQPPQDDVTLLVIRREAS